MIYTLARLTVLSHETLWAGWKCHLPDLNPGESLHSCSYGASERDNIYGLRSKMAPVLFWNLWQDSFWGKQKQFAEEVLVLSKRGSLGIVVLKSHSVASANRTYGIFTWG